MKKILYVTMMSVILSVKPALADICHIGLTDSTNHFSTVISATIAHQGKDDIYTVTNQGMDPVQITFRSTTNTKAMVDMKGANVHLSTLEAIMAKYSGNTAALLRNESVQENQDTWTPVDTTECTSDQISLIEFLVMEWFYYG
jgi:hypothetical protein